MPNQVIQAPVTINVSSMHIAKVTSGQAAEYVADTPIHIIGLRKWNRKPELAEGKLYGDGVVRKKVTKKTGYLIEVEANAFPPDLRAYMEGQTITEGGIEYAAPSDVPGIIAFGGVNEKDDGTMEMIWYPYCQAQPIEKVTEQSEDKTNFSTDKITLLAMSHPQIVRFFSLIDTGRPANKNITPKQFFSQVQTGDTVVDADA